MKVFHWLVACAILIGLALPGCTSLATSRGPVAGPAKVAPISPPAKQAAADASAALTAYDKFVEFLSTVTPSNVSSVWTKVMESARNTREPIAAAKASTGTTAAAAAAKDAENDGLRRSLDTANAKIEERDKKIESMQSDFRRKLEIYSALLALAAAVAIWLLVSNGKITTAIGVGIGAGVAIGFLITLGWFDDHKGLIILCGIGAFVVTVAGVILYRRLHDGLTWTQALVKAITTSPQQDVQDILHPTQSEDPRPVGT